MPRWPQKKKTVDPPVIAPAEARRIVPVDLPYPLWRELQEISKNTGREFDLTAPIEELEKICNECNRPADSWRNRWRG